MNGIVFLATQNRSEVVEFYRERVGMTTWLEQADCTVLEFENLLLGFCSRSEVEKNGIITFVYDNREAVDETYEKLKDIAMEKPEPVEKYQIYRFFAEDPEGRTIEFQSFDHPV